MCIGICPSGNARGLFQGCLIKTKGKGVDLLFLLFYKTVIAQHTTENKMSKSLDSMTVSELKKEAKGRGKSGYSKLRKQELIDLITDSDFSHSDDMVVTLPVVDCNMKPEDTVPNYKSFLNKSRTDRRRAAYMAKLAMRSARRAGSTVIRPEDWEFAERNSKPSDFFSNAREMQAKVKQRLAKRIPMFGLSE